MDETPAAGVYQLPPSVYATITSDGAMLLDSRGRGTWFMVNPAGARLLRELLDGANLHAAAEAVADHYRAQRVTVHTDLARLTAELHERGLLTRPASGACRW